MLGGKQPQMSIQPADAVVLYVAAICGGVAGETFRAAVHVAHNHDN